MAHSEHKDRSGTSRPKKSLGQNFLSDPNTARRIVSLVDVSPGDRILEIGPGRGALTGILSELVDERGQGLLVALEKDIDLAFVLPDAAPGVRVVVADATGFAWESLGRERPWKVVGNLPYNVASPIMWDLFSRAPGLERAVFMIQKEVGQRIAARPGSRSYGALSVWIQSFVTPKMEFVVPPTVFRPRPKVDSAVLSFRPRKEIFSFDHVALSVLIKLCFQKRRKQLGNILKSFKDDKTNAWFEEQGLSWSMRPEDLSPEQFRGLGNLLGEFFIS